MCVAQEAADPNTLEGNIDLQESGVIAQGAEATTNTPAQFLDYVKQETALYGKIIKTANIRIE